jgi:predicted metal-dependent peptidase
VHVLYVDTQVQRHDTFEAGDEFGLEFFSGGGTDMVSGLKYLDAEGIEPDVFVCLTDGYFSTTADQAPSHPVIWCISSDQTPAFGEVVRFELES